MCVFSGLLYKDIIPLQESSLSGILTLGGTILGTAREKEFRKILKSPDKKDQEMIKKVTKSLHSTAWFASEATALRKLPGHCQNWD